MPALSVDWVPQIVRHLRFRLSRELKMFGRFFGKRQDDAIKPESKADLLGGYMLFQLMTKNDPWGLPKAFLDECSDDAGPEVHQRIQFWLRIYCAWMFRFYITQRFGETNTVKEMMAIIRLRSKGFGKEIVNTLEYWFEMLDKAIFEAPNDPKFKGDKADAALLKVTRNVAIMFLVGDPQSPWYGTKESPPQSAWHGVIVAITKVFARIVEVMPQIVDKVAGAGGSAMPIA